MVTTYEAGRSAGATVEGLVAVPAPNYAVLFLIALSFGLLFWKAKKG